jgi:hypothetical protein
MGATNNMLWHMLVQVLIVLFLIVAVSGLGVGVGLIVSREKTSQLFHRLNRWVSTRHALKSVEIPRDTERLTHQYQRWLAACFVLGGLFAAFVLATSVDVTGISRALVERRFVPFLAVVLDSARWFLIVGSAAGVVIGAMLLFYPNAESALERFANQWVSSRRVVRSGDDLHMTLDTLVEAHPTPAGWVLACTSAAAVLCAVFMLVRYY